MSDVIVAGLPGAGVAADPLHEAAPSSAREISVASSAGSWGCWRAECEDMVRPYHRRFRPVKPQRDAVDAIDCDVDMDRA